MRNNYVNVTEENATSPVTNQNWRVKKSRFMMLRAVVVS